MRVLVLSLERVPLSLSSLVLGDVLDSETELGSGTRKHVTDEMVCVL